MNDFFINLDESPELEEGKVGIYFGSAKIEKHQDNQNDVYYRIVFSKICTMQTIGKRPSGFFNDAVNIYGVKRKFMDLVHLAEKDDAFTCFYLGSFTRSKDGRYINLNKKRTELVKYLVISS